MCTRTQSLTTTSRWRNAAHYSASRSAELPASRSASPSDQLLLAASVHLLSATVPHYSLRGVGWRELDRSKPASSCGMRSAGGKPSISPRLRTRLSAPTLLTITLVAAMCGVSPMGDAAGTALRLYDVPAGMAGTDDRMHRAVSQVGAILANILTALRTVPMTACGVLARRSDDRRSLVACWFREGGKAGAVARSSPAKCPCHPDASR